MNKLICLFAFLIGNFSCNAQQSNSNRIQNYVDNFIADADFAESGIGIMVKDAENETVLAHYNSAMVLTPASCQKLLTTAAALEILTPEYRFKTQIETDGTIKNGILHGNLIVHGLGDPCLQSKYFKRTEPVTAQIVDKLKSLSVDRITGQIVCDKSYFKPSIPATWIWEDIGNYYGAVPQALNYNDNLYRLYFTSGKAGTATKIQKIEPVNTGLNFENQVMSSRINKDLAYIFGGNTSTKRRIEGSIPQNRKSFVVKGALSNPEIPLTKDLEDEMERGNLKLDNHNFASSGKNQVLFNLYSPSLSEIVRQTNRKSINLFADQFLFEIALHSGKAGNWTSGAQTILDFWKAKKINTDGLRLLDGSGLSHFNAISADFFGELLCYMYHSEYKTAFLSSLPVAGESGTLKHFGKGSEIESVWKAKTGSMTGVRSYCGYLQAANGKVYVISILINNYNCSGSELNNKLLSFLINIYNS